MSQSFCVQYKTKNGLTETLVFGNENVAKNFAKTQCTAKILVTEISAPNVTIKVLAPRGRARHR